MGIRFGLGKLELLLHFKIVGNWFTCWFIVQHVLLISSNWLLSDMFFLGVESDKIKDSLLTSHLPYSIALNLYIF
jgi:hypothetical protein